MSQLVLLTVTGTPNAKTLDAAWTLHNQTAGAPERAIGLATDPAVREYLQSRYSGNRAR